MSLMFNHISNTCYVYLSKNNRWVFFSVTLIAFLIYIPFINNPLVFDDLGYFYQYGANLFKDLHSNFQLRWFSHLTIKWTWDLFSDFPEIHRLGNVIIHLANSFLLFFLYRYYLYISNDNLSANNREFGAWLAVVVFVCNPVSVYAVGYIVQRSILLATLFTLLMQIAFINGLLRGKRFLLLITVILYGAAVFSKEHAIAAILLLPFIYLIAQRKVLVKKSDVIGCMFGCIVIATYAYLMTKGIIGQQYEHDASMLVASQGLDDSISLFYLSIATQTGLFFKYLYMWCIPNPGWMSIDMRIALTKPDAYLEQLLHILGFLFYGFAALYTLNRNWHYRIIGFAFLYPWLFFLIELSSIRIQEPFVLYRSYLWIPGLLLLIPVILQKEILITPTKRIAISLILIFILVPMSWNRLWTFADNYKLWNDAALLMDHDDEPGAARIFYNRGKALQAKGRWPESIEDFERVAKLAPNIDQAYINIGYSNYNMKKYREAMINFEFALKLNPSAANAYFGKGLTSHKLKKNQAAIAAFEKACDLGHPTACILKDFVSKLN